MPQNSSMTGELEQKLKRFIKLTLKDISVKLGDEFDRNFEREAFFNEKWARRKFNDDESRGLLSREGTLRRTIKKEASVTDHSVVFTSSVPYAAIHNEGGTITVTRKMKKYFWYRYLLIMGSKRSRPDKPKFTEKLQRKKSGELRDNQKNRELTEEAKFCKIMALKKVGSKIVIPKRQFIGMHPEVERIIREIADANRQTVF
ncbi:phage virion morphogenesis protein [Bacteroides stercorirosoris]|uniref:Mu-like prophage protein gpG n=1 Tax=Bacteroides stercorirosoris TaxID=871324 RepID=A0A1M6I8F1_9BACE|nr:phage virion morphogenesis protein [Bacteroides stercorirosoris]SHJ30730.1 Mu-like prophage protein gpG [Bacteroides stercorirosoris]